MPIPIGVAPNQPSTVSSIAPTIKKYWKVFVGIAIAIQLMTMLNSHNEQVYVGQFVYRPNDPEKVKVSPPFELKYGSSNVNFNLYSPVQNNWLEIQADLINDQTGESYEFEQGVEYYSGYDSDGSWSEGSFFNDKTLSSVPEGTYHLNVEALSQVASYPNSATGTETPGQSYTITVRRDVISWSNCLWAIGFISIFPFMVWWRDRSFNMSRWSNSDFSPYYQHQEGE